MNRLRAAMATLVGLAAATLIALGAWTVAQHEHARAGYSEIGRRLLAGDARYDAEASDRAYAETAALEEQAALVSWWALSAMVLTGLLWPPAGGRAGAPRNRRALGATLLDAVAPLLALGLGLWLGSAFGAEHRALGELVSRVMLGALGSAWLASWGRGRTPGAVALGLRFVDASGEPPGTWRGLAAVALIPLGLLSTPFAWRAERAPAHLGWVGLQGAEARA